MLSVQDVQTYVKQLSTVDNFTDLEARLSDVLAEIGFSYYALVHHVDVISPPLGFVRTTNYPESWKQAFVAYRYYADDPTRLACQTTASPFQWGKLGDVISLTRRQKEFMRAAAKNGLGLGYTVPIHVPSHVSGSANFATKAGEELRDSALPVAHHIAVFTFDAARRLAENKAIADLEPVRLTSRQREVVSLVAQGKSNWVTGKILGISDRTVKEHLQEAMLHYGVSSRTELVVRSLFDGNLSFADIIPNHGSSRGRGR